MLKLIGFNHMDATYINNHFPLLAVNEGSIGLAFDLKHQTVIDAIVDPSKRAVVIDRAKVGDEEGDELLIAFDEEVQDLRFVLPMMFNVGLTDFYWCFECHHVSSTTECNCSERKGVTGISW